MKLRFTSPALDDLRKILAYIHARSPMGAERLSRRLDEILDHVREHPGMGSPTDRPRQRMLVIIPFPYVVFYEATETEIIVHAVRHGARDVR